MLKNLKRKLFKQSKMGLILVLWLLLILEILLARLWRENAWNLLLCFVMSMIS